jgi:hypothetical protein
LIALTSALTPYVTAHKGQMKLAHFGTSVSSSIISNISAIQDKYYPELSNFFLNNQVTIKRSEIIKENTELYLNLTYHSRLGIPMLSIEYFEEGKDLIFSITQ